MTEADHRKQSRAFVKSGEFGILLSHASEDTVPGLVWGSYPSIPEATADAVKITQHFEIMAKIDGQWQAMCGETPIEVLRRRWM